MDVGILRIYMTTLSEIHLKSHIDKCWLVIFVPHDTHPPAFFLFSLFVCSVLPTPLLLCWCNLCLMWCDLHVQWTVLFWKIQKNINHKHKKKTCRLQDAVANLEQGIVTERQCTQLVEQHEAAQDWLREQVKSLGPPPADRQSLHSAVNTLKVRKWHAFKRVFKHLWLVTYI